MDLLLENLVLSVQFRKRRRRNSHVGEAAVEKLAPHDHSHTTPLPKSLCRGEKIDVLWLQLLPWFRLLVEISTGMWVAGGCLT